MHPGKTEDQPAGNTISRELLLDIETTGSREEQIRHNNPEAASEEDEDDEEPVDNSAP